MREGREAGVARLTLELPTTLLVVSFALLFLFVYMHILLHVFVLSGIVFFCRMYESVP